MGCPQLNEEYEGRIIEMGTKNGKGGKRAASESSNGSKESSNRKKFKLHSVYKKILQAAITLSISVATAAFTIGVVYTNINRDLEYLKEAVTNIDVKINGDPKTGAEGIYTRVVALENAVKLLDDSLQDTVKTVDNINGRLIAVETALDFYVKLDANGTKVAKDESLNIENNDFPQTKSSYEANESFGVTADGEEYLAKDLIDQSVLLTYDIENGGKVFFFGQLNKNYHWDGFCITNTYTETNTLAGICEYNFDDGTRLNYRSFYPSTENNIWVSTDRVTTKNGNQGVTDKYNLVYTNSTDVDLTDLDDVAILLVNDLLAMCTTDAHLTHYNGLTSQDYYNDTTGSAYEIIYDTDGDTIKTLYIGQFKDGQFHDHTGNAMEIVFDDSSPDINRYFYYKGSFTNGKRDEKVSGKNYVTLDQIDNIIQGMVFDCELKWHST